METILTGKSLGSLIISGHKQVMRRPLVIIPPVPLVEFEALLDQHRDAGSQELF